jgi:hypothetical protein
MPGESVISVVCGCGKKLKAPSAAAGKKARCPACSSVVVLPSFDKSGEPEPVVAAKAAPPAPSIGAVQEQDDGLGGMYDVAEPTDLAASAPAGPRCPQCKAAMEDGAVLCTNCGYDKRTGKSLSAAAPVTGKASAKAIKNADEPVDYMAPQGSLVLGVVFSAVFALIASVLWIVVAWLTGYAIAYIAILIGAAAGVGMQIGHKGYSKTGGIVASIMTIAAILIAKFIVLEALLARTGRHLSDLETWRVNYYFFSPIGLIIILVGVGAAYRTANGSSSN